MAVSISLTFKGSWTHKLRSSFNRIASVRGCLCLCLTLLLLPNQLFADPIVTKANHNHSVIAAGGSVISTRSGIATDSGVRLRFAPLALAGGSEMTLISPADFNTLAASLSDSVTKIHHHLTSIFGTIPPFKSSVRLMDEETFFATTGAPPWTNAIYLRGQIIIPVSTRVDIDRENLERSIRHEYSHAVLSAMSAGRAPGWLDEGFAQWIEGSENSSIRPTMLHYLKFNRPLPFDLLQGGFTRLDPAIVPAAYAQSYLASQTVIESLGFPAIASYLSELRSGTKNHIAFARNFGMSEFEFERRFRKRLVEWSKHRHSHSANQESH